MKEYKNEKLKIHIVLKENLVQRDLEMFELEYNSLTTNRSGTSHQLGCMLRAAKKAGWIIESEPVINDKYKTVNTETKISSEIDPVGELPPVVVKAFGSFINSLYLEVTTIPNDSSSL